MHLLCVGALKSSFELHEMGDISQQVEFNEQTTRRSLCLAKMLVDVFYIIVSDDNFNNLMSCIIFVALDEKNIEHGGNCQ